MPPLILAYPSRRFKSMQLHRPLPLPMTLSILFLLPSSEYFTLPLRFLPLCWSPFEYFLPPSDPLSGCLVGSSCLSINPAGHSVSFHKTFSVLFFFWLFKMSEVNQKAVIFLSLFTFYFSPCSLFFHKQANENKVSSPPTHTDTHICSTFNECSLCFSLVKCTRCLSCFCTYILSDSLLVNSVRYTQTDTRTQQF